eukprot:350050_1
MTVIMMQLIGPLLQMNSFNLRMTKPNVHLSTVQLYQNTNQQLVSLSVYLYFYHYLFVSFKCIRCSCKSNIFNSNPPHMPSLALLYFIQWSNLLILLSQWNVLIVSVSNVTSYNEYCDDIPLKLCNDDNYCTQRGEPFCDPTEYDSFWCNCLSNQITYDIARVLAMCVFIATIFEILQSIFVSMMVLNVKFDGSKYYGFISRHIDSIFVPVLLFQTTKQPQCTWNHWLKNCYWKKHKVFEMDHHFVRRLILTNIPVFVCAAMVVNIKWFELLPMIMLYVTVIIFKLHYRYTPPVMEHDFTIHILCGLFGESITSIICKYCFDEEKIRKGNVKYKLLTYACDIDTDGSIIYACYVVCVASVIMMVVVPMFVGNLFLTK